MDQFVFVYPPCEDSVAKHALTRPCRAHEQVYMKPRLNSHGFIYVYDYLFKEYNITFPLTDFEAGMLNLMNIAPSQLHPNSWAFLRCFELLCDQLGLVPSVNTFTYFYQMKFEKPVGWVSLSSSHESPSSPCTTRPTSILRQNSSSYTDTPKTWKGDSCSTPITLCDTPCTDRNLLGFRPYLTTKYTNNGAPRGGPINIGSTDKSLLMLMNMSSQASSHVKVLAPFRSLKNGFAFSASLGRKRERATNFPFNC